MKEKLIRFMYGRYGQDRLGRFLNFVALGLLLISVFTGFMPLYAAGILVAIYVLYRSFSRNIARRRAEGAWFDKQFFKVKNYFIRLKKRFAQRKTHKLFKCPSCKQTLSVPKGKGKLKISCPKCQTSFEAKT